METAQLMTHKRMETTAVPFTNCSSAPFYLPSFSPSVESFNTKAQNPFLETKTNTKLNKSKQITFKTNNRH